MIGIPSLSRNKYLVKIGDSYEREIAGTELSPEDAAMEVAAAQIGVYDVWDAYRTSPNLSDEDYIVQFDDDARTKVEVTVIKLGSELV